MIKSIVLNNCTPYKKAMLSDCKKVNFIFGSNGSGKTTISSFLDGDQSCRFSSSIIEWNSEQHETICVYNKNFRNNNFQQTIPGVFTIGSATIEDIKALTDLKKEHDERGEQLNQQEITLQNLEDKLSAREKRFKDEAWNSVLKQNENGFKKAFDGFRGSKDAFCNELKRRIESEKGEVCDKDNLKLRAQALYVKRPERCEKFNLDIKNKLDRLEEIRRDQIWSKVIAGNKDIDIAALIDELDCSPWVSQGRKYLIPNSKKCPFCQQNTITKEFREKLDSFFDKEYEKQIGEMKSLLEEYESQKAQIISACNSIVNNVFGVTIGKLDISLFSEKVKVFQSDADININKIEKKIVETGLKIELIDLSDDIQSLIDIITIANSLIDEHNKLVNDRDTAVNKLTDDVWRTCINEAHSLVQSYLDDTNDIRKGIDGIKESIKLKKEYMSQLEDNIVEKGKNITSVQPTIDEINRSLRAYGFTNFSIQPSDDHDNYYCIKRDDGTLAVNTLSEGEETFLTFLYFMQWTKGSTSPDHVNDKKIIVLDDPISSLDSNILYIVGAMVKDLSRGICKGDGDVTQLFVFTHNVFFHKEASFDPRNALGDNVNFWMIRKDNDVSTIQNYKQKNPISTSYELLWSEIRENKNISLISVQNDMRRIIENYFGMLGKERDERLIAGFDNVEDQMIARSLIYWINDGSHTIPDDLNIDSYTDAVPKYKSVFKAIFEKNGHIAHYNMMMGIQNGR